MYKLLSRKLLELNQKQVPATGIGIFRILFGLVTFQEICFLLYFNHLIFDPVPYIDVEFPMIPFFLCLWGIAALAIIIGYRTQTALICNYIFWILFVNFTPMQRDFDGGFDLFMIGTCFFLLFMPSNRSFSIDNLRLKLSRPFVHYSQYNKATTSILAYYIPVAVCLGFLYFDSAIHKMFAEHWRNGLGAWLPSTQPLYVSALNMSWLLNNEILQKTIGYTILVFQFTFIFFFTQPTLRIFYLFIGIGLHLGITVTFNIYPFGLGMLSFYSLLIPFSWFRKIAELCQAKQPALHVFYDENCPLCNRTILILNHFDIFNSIDFKGAQTHSSSVSALTPHQQDLLTDLYAVDNNNNVYKGIDSYIQILLKMRYTAFLALFMRLPGIYHYCARKYRRIADQRIRLDCSDNCISTHSVNINTWYDKLFDQSTDSKHKLFFDRLSKTLIVILILQFNSSIHYGLLYRLGINTHQNSITTPLAQASNSILMLSQTFLGITPHALYLHDHFEGYERIIGISFVDQTGNERWLPFVNQQGRLLAPNWGRVHSMWANIAVTPNINTLRLKKFIMKVTAFWGRNIKLDINKTTFNIKLKHITSSNSWVPNQLNNNFNSDWITIGTAHWTDNSFSTNIPLNINKL